MTSIVADITRCYESIPLQGLDNLLDTISFITRIAFQHVASSHPRSIVALWVRIGTDRVPACARWATSQPSTTNWFALEAHTSRKIGLV
jgi:hypothetical protein